MRTKPAQRLLGASCCFIVALLLGSAGFARGDSLTFSPTSSTAGDGQSFSFTVTLNTTHAFYGFSLYLESSAASSFSVTGETAATSSPITDPNFIGSFPVLLTTTANSPDFGYSSTGTTDISAGTYTIGTITIAVAASVPVGTFTINTTTGITGSEYNDAEGDIFLLPEATETVSVPEPTTAALIVCILAAILPRRSKASIARPTPFSTLSVH